MKNEQEIRDLVKEKYSQIALQSKESNTQSCCGATSCCGSKSVDYTIMSEDYTALDGYVSEADLGLGCGLPTEFAQIKEGNTVLDLGSGAGNDCFVARAATGASGKVIGVDMTETMINKARENAEKLGFNNVEFRLGEIENLPVSNETIDVVVSNCVLNLVPNKKQALSETYRVLRAGGHFSISDIVLEGQLPEALQKAAEMYAGCVAGAMQKTDYLELIKETGFENVAIQKEKAIILPNEILSNYLTDAQITDFEQSKIGIFSITVYAEKQ